MHTKDGFYSVHFDTQEIEKILNGYIPNIYKKEEFFYVKYERAIVLFDIYNMQEVRDKPELIHNCF